MHVAIKPSAAAEAALWLLFSPTENESNYREDFNPPHPPLHYYPCQGNEADFSEDLIANFNRVNLKIDVWTLPKRSGVGHRADPNTQSRAWWDVPGESISQPESLEILLHNDPF